MKTIYVLFAIGCLTAHAQNHFIPLSVDLTGAQALPPNNNPVTARAFLWFGTRYVGGTPQFPGTPPSGTLTRHTLSGEIWFIPSNLALAPDLVASSAAI